MRYVLAFFCPWLVFFTIGKVGRGIICLILQCTVVGWLPATIWAFASVGGYNADKRTDRIVSAIKSQPVAAPRPDPRQIISPIESQPISDTRPDPHLFGGSPPATQISHLQLGSTKAPTDPIPKSNSAARVLLLASGVLICCTLIAAFVIIWRSSTGQPPVPTPLKTVDIPQTRPPAPDPEIVFWQSITNSSDTSDFEEYLRTYPDGHFTGLARNRLAALRKPPPVPPSPTPPAPQQSPPPIAPQQWGAAVHAGNDWAFSFQDASESEARAEALQLCRNQYPGSGCEVVAATNGCVAIAENPNGWAAWATRPTSDGAESAALAQCIDSNKPNCQVTKISCAVEGIVRSLPAPDDGLFEFQVCNESAYKASVAIAGRRAPTSGEWRVIGWYSVNPTACRTIGRFAEGDFFMMAQVFGDASRGWIGTDITLCVQYPGPFEYIQATTQNCDVSRLKGFRKINVSQKTLTWTLNNGPPDGGD